MGRLVNEDQMLWLIIRDEKRTRTFLTCGQLWIWFSAEWVQSTVPHPCACATGEVGVVSPGLSGVFSPASRGEERLLLRTVQPLQSTGLPRY